MIPKSPCRLGAGLVVVLVAVGCGREFEALKPVPPNTDPVVFDDAFGDAVDFQAFLGSKVDALDIDTNEAFEGSASLKVTVPGPGDPSGGFAGGAFPTFVARDLSGYDALTFWAKSSVPSTLNIAGLGNDNTGTSLFEASWSDIPLTTAWGKVIVAIPLPDRLTSERGLFFFAEGPEGGVGHTIWFDEVRFESVGAISNPRPVMPRQTLNAIVGATVSVTGTQTILDVAGSNRTIDHQPGYFTFASSNTDVATTTGAVIRVVGAGDAIITAKLGPVDAVGEVTLSATSPPMTAAPAPTLAARDVISLYSNAYTNVRVDTWSAVWDRADVSDLKIASDDVKAYTNLVFAGVEFTSETIDASQMTHFHMDVWVPEGSEFRVKLVDFGADGTFGGAPDSEHELVFNAGSNPALEIGTWVALDVPLSAFTRLSAVEHLAQLVLGGNTGTAFVDNVYFHK